MLNIWKTGPDSYTITIEQNVQFQVGIYHEKCPFDQLQNDRPTATFVFNMGNNWKTCQIAGPSGKPCQTARKLP